MSDRMFALRVYLISLFSCLQSPLGRGEENHGLFQPVGTNVQVITRDGRMLRGQIDARSTSEILWLSVTQENITIASHLSIEMLASITAAPPIQLPYDSTPSVVALRPAFPAHQQINSPGRVVSLHTFARSANWDGDAEIDGLELYLLPLDQFGRQVPATGLVSAELTVYRGDARLQDGAVERHSWTIPVTVDTPISEAASLVRLPFRDLQPEHELDLQPFGDLHVRFAVSGQRVVESTISGIELCPFSPTQDLRRVRKIR